MFGTIVNAIAIVLCSLIGVIISKKFKNGIPHRFQEIIMKALGLAVLFIGISGALETKNTMVLIFSIVLGAILGELINIDKGMKRLGDYAESKMGFSEGNFSKGFVTATLLFCTGSMAIVGALEGGLSGNHEMLLAKAILDGTISIIFAYQMGIGVTFSAIPVFLYQGTIAVIAMFARDFIPAEMIIEMSAAGSLVVAAIGINFLTNQEIKVANMIPAVFMPCIFLLF